MSSESEPGDKATGLSSAKREDIWALIIAGIVMLLSIAAPEAVYNFFKERALHLLGGGGWPSFDRWLSRVGPRSSRV